MKTQNAVILPEKFLLKFAQEVFTPLKKGECVSCMFVAGGGKRTVVKHILSKKEILKDLFGDQYKKTLFVYVDPDEILNVTTEAYLQLILDNLVLKMAENKITNFSESFISNPLILIKRNLEILVRKGWATVFILNDFEFTLNLPSSIYLNLESIMSIDKPKIVYLFLSTINLFDETVLKRLHNLKHAVSRNIRYFPLFNQNEANYLIDRISEKLKIDISEKVRSVLYELCGGHPQLLKYSLNNLFNQGQNKLMDYKKAKLFLLEDYQLNIVCADIWNFLSQREREIITSVVASGNLVPSAQNEPDYLLKLGVIKKIADKKYQVFGTLFTEFVKNKLPKHKLFYDVKTKKLYYGNQSCEDKFTYQEFKILVYFITHENELITRDQVAEVIWGRLYHDKFSDWSIDKSISILRKKLDALGFPSEQLVTLKKRGFSFSLS